MTTSTTSPKTNPNRKFTITRCLDGQPQYNVTDSNGKCFLFDTEEEATKMLPEVEALDRARSAYFNARPSANRVYILPSRFTYVVSR